MEVKENPFDARAELKTHQGPVSIFRLSAIAKEIPGVNRLPFSIKILLENLLRNCDTHRVTKEDVFALARWEPMAPSSRELPFMPARILLQDFTGVPVIVDLAAMRSAIRRAGGDPKRVNPLIPADLVIDHSVQVDAFGTSQAFLQNVQREFERNKERYAFLRWAKSAFSNLSIVPPGTGIVHQVNLEYLARVVQVRKINGADTAFPDTVLGTDSHTTMINGLGVFGWGVGGIEAEACLLGQPFYMLAPNVLGFKLTGEMPEGATATDLVLTATQMLRKHGVVNKFVEFYGEGLKSLSLPDRATLANMAPEYGATMGFFPVDEETLLYLRQTGRDPKHVELVERYTKEQGLFRSPEIPEPIFSETLSLNLGSLEPCLAGPRRPQDLVLLKEAKQSFAEALKSYKRPEGGLRVEVKINGGAETLGDGSIVIAAITSCTNTSNPSVMLAAGLLAKKAVERGLGVKEYVKTSLAPGSRVVTDYLQKSGLSVYLDKLRFHLVGYGCTTCIGNSGPLPQAISSAIKENELVAVAVLSGNRNFEGRIHPSVRAAYLVSPPLVVAYALAGRMDIDLVREPLGKDKNGKAVFLKEIWPTPKEIQKALSQAISAEMFQSRYSHVFEGDEIWKEISAPQGDLYLWDEASTYIAEPPYFRNFSLEPSPVSDIQGARVLAMLGDSVTTDHISPAGNISPEGPAGKYLMSRGVEAGDFNSFGARRGHHEVMMRGTFGNVRLKNILVEGTEGCWTLHFPSETKMSVYEASQRYHREGVPLVVLAGKEYGSGSSRDWAAKGTMLLGVQAVIAESFERIHRSNLVGMGLLPLQFKPGESAKSLGLSGHETYTLKGISTLSPGKNLSVSARRDDGSEINFGALACLSGPMEVEYYRNGGILPTVLRRMIS